MAACRQEAPELRQEIVNSALDLINRSGDSLLWENSAIVSGLVGLAESPVSDDKIRQLSRKLSTKLDPSNLTFTEQIDSIWSLCALQLYDTKALESLIKNLNGLNFERLDNELRYEEYMKMLDIHNALKIEAPKHLQITNQGLLTGLNGPELYMSVRYEEHLTRYDPFKQRVVQALAKGLTNASIEH